MTESQKAGLFLSLTELVGDVSLREYAKTGSQSSLVVGTASYIGLEALMIRYLKNNKLSIVNGYWDGFSNILTTMAGMALGESLSPLQITGLLMISAGVLMLEWKVVEGEQPK
jgi:multidrug transporter EmrE-like cation transporter